MTFDDYFEQTWPQHWAVLKMYEDGSQAVDALDTLLPRTTKQIAEKTWNAAIAAEREACARILEAEELANMPIAADNNGRQSDFAFGAVESTRRMMIAIRMRANMERTK